VDKKNGTWAAAVASSLSSLHVKKKPIEEWKVSQEIAKILPHQIQHRRKIQTVI
jgi:hypothetical protein